MAPWVSSVAPSASAARLQTANATATATACRPASPAAAAKPRAARRHASVDAALAASSTPRHGVTRNSRAGTLVGTQAEKGGSRHQQMPKADDVPRRALVLLGAGLTICCGCGCGCGRAYASGPPLPNRNALLDRFFASCMNTGMVQYEELLSPVKNQLFDEALSTAQSDGSVTEVLEVGVGTAPNLKYYGHYPNIRITGLDPNLAMEQYAKENARDAGLGPDDFSVVTGVLEDMPVGDSSVDLVVGTLVLCSVEDAQRAVNEILRVLKPGGKYLFIEHVAAPKGTLTGRLQDILTPLQTILADGCHLNRQTGKTIENVGFSEVDIRRFTVEELSILGPHVAGIATK